MTVTPEQIELDKKLRVFERLKDRLATSEEEMTDLRAELEQFEARYTMDVARLYAEHDEIEAQIAEEEYKLVPDDEEIKKKAEELRRKAEDSAARAAEEEKKNRHFEPTAETRKAYHNLARIIHPDLALDAIEKEKRHELMAELNEAYSTGDQAKLDKLAADFRAHPDLITGDTVGDQLVRVIRQIAQVKTRLNNLKIERTEAEQSELYELRQKVAVEMAEGRDMLAQMAARTRAHIKKSERRLTNLREVNKAAEEHVKETFGMDITDFRPSDTK